MKSIYISNKFIVSFFIASAVLLITSPAHASYDDGTFFTGTTCDIRPEVDGWTLINDNLERRIRVDANGIQTVSLLKKPENVYLNFFSSTEGKFYIDGILYDLSQGWVLDTASTSIAGPNKILSVTMKQPLHNWSVIIEYTVYPGTRQWIRKQLRFRLDQPHIISNVSIDVIDVKSELLSWFYDGSGGRQGLGGVIDNNPVGCAVFTSFPQGKGAVIQSTNNTTQVSTFEPYWNNSIVRQNFDELVCFSIYFSGAKITAPFAIQLADTSAFSRSNPWFVPTVYNTWYAYGNQIIQANVEFSVPLAASLGCKIYVIDDGWERNITYLGAYGDWIVDYAKFPIGIIPLSNLVHQYGMDFGIWLAPCQTQYSYERVAHPDWAIKYQSGAVDDTLFCLASGWQNEFTTKIMTIVQQTNARFVKLDFDMFRDTCDDTTHNHIPGAAIGEQYESWKALVSNLRSTRSDFIVDRANNTPDCTDVQDQGWANDWIISSRQSAPNKYLVAFWQFNADLTRYAEWYPLQIQPSYAMTGTAPAHIDGLENNQNLHEYLLASVAASYANLEISNYLEGITNQERAWAQKWIKFNWSMRPWLTYTQPISRATPVGLVQYGTEPIDALWHIRPLYKGRYGFFAAFNPRNSAQSITATFDPKLYLMPNVSLNNVVLTSMNSQGTVTNSSVNGKLTITANIPAQSWQVIDIRDPAAIVAGDTNEDNCVDDTDLLNIIYDFLSVPNLHGTTDLNGDGVVDDTDLLIVINNFMAGCS